MCRAARRTTKKQPPPHITPRNHNPKEPLHPEFSSFSWYNVLHCPQGTTTTARQPPTPPPPMAPLRLLLKRQPRRRQLWIRTVLASRAFLRSLRPSPHSVHSSCSRFRIANILQYCWASRWCLRLSLGTFFAVSTVPTHGAAPQYLRI